MSVINATIDIRRGEFKIIRVDGREELIEEKPTLDRIHKAIGCDTIDAVPLTFSHNAPALVMIADDNGMIDGKPVNQKATELYRAICKPATFYSIHGDVAICDDRDFS